MGETFVPDLQTGTGNLTLPITVPAGRNGLQPELALSYSTGQGNGPAGLGWSVPVPGVSRKTARGVPRYRPGADTFLLGGTEDLVPVEDLSDGGVRYRPRTEGAFIRVVAYPDHWRATSLDGLQSRYAVPTADPVNPDRVFSWSLSSTTDLLGNIITYDYTADAGDAGGHRWDRPVLSEIRWADLPGPGGTTRFFARVALESEPRPDPFSVYTAGFEIRTTLRYRAVTSYVVDDRLGGERAVRRYELRYEQDPYTGVSLLTEVTVVGFDDVGKEHRDLPPVRLGYDRLDPVRRRLVAVADRDGPGVSLRRRDHALVDLTGDGLPDVLQLNGIARWWRNRGGGRFDRPRSMPETPAGVRLADPGVALLDVQGDGRADLSVSTGPLAGYFPLRFGPTWGRRHLYSALPPTGLSDPAVRLVDLTGDGVTDVILLGDRMACAFQQTVDGATTWTGLQPAQFDLDPAGPPPRVGPDDDRLRWADMSGDGLTDLVLVRDREVEYWPSLGHGRFARRVRMRGAPRLPADYRPDRLLLGDLDGDGRADLAYVAGGTVTVWFNRAGEGWSDPVRLPGVPEDAWDVRIADLLGTGVGGLVFSRDAGSAGTGQSAMYVLDLTGGVRPRLLAEVDNGLGTLTRVAYASSAQFAAADAAHPSTRWRTPLPIPVAVVVRLETIDRVSGGKLTSSFRYAHGYWDGHEREFRGFARVDRLDTETFDAYHGDPLLPETPFVPVDRDAFSPPTLTRTWFHVGPVETDAEGEWAAPDLSAEFWAGDPPLLPGTEIDRFLRGLPPSDRRDALRALRGRVLRTEVYARDGSSRAHRPYTVSEQAYALREEPARRRSGVPRVFMALPTLERITQWERGNDPRTRFIASGDFDVFGRPQRRTEVALPRRSARRTPVTAAVIGTVDIDVETVLALHTVTVYADAGDPTGPRDRVAEMQTKELLDPPGVTESNPSDVRAVLRDQLETVRQVVAAFNMAGATRLIGRTVHHYDGLAWIGRPVGEVGAHGLLTRTETLVFTDEVLGAAYGMLRPQALGGVEPPPAGAPPGALDALGYRATPEGWYADTLCQAFDVQLATPDAPNPGRGLVLGVRSPLGHESRVVPDTGWLRPARIRDPAGLETVATYDYRAGGPRTVTDPNGTTTTVTYHPLGMVASVALTGADGSGDTAAAPGTTYTYDLSSFSTAGQPISVHTRRRVWHVSDGISDEVVESREYSDGLGRLVQKLAQADDLAFDSDTGVGLLVSDGEAGLIAEPGWATSNVSGQRWPDRVVVSGWRVYDNKGRIVAEYEPFFSRGWDYLPAAAARHGRKRIMRYDALGQQVGVLNPDGSQSMTVMGLPADLSAPSTAEPSPWVATSYDENDLAAVSTDPAGGSLAGRAPGSHHFTPASAVQDALGRTVAQIVRAGPGSANWHLTRTSYTLGGQPLRILDELGRAAFVHTYDLAARLIRADGIDLGYRVIVLDAVGNTIAAQDARGCRSVRMYDRLDRLTTVHAANAAGVALTLREVLTYGDAGDPGQPTAERNEARAHGRLGRVWRHLDEAGLVVVEDYKFTGEPTAQVRQVVDDVAIAAAEPAGWTADWARAGAINDLDPLLYRTRTSYDALGRAVRITVPTADPGGNDQVLSPVYGRSGALRSVSVDGVPYLREVVHDAAGRRVLVAYGDGTTAGQGAGPVTRYAYDPDTFRLVRQRSERMSPGPGDTWTRASGPTGAAWQDLTYRHDLAGNITLIEDRTSGCGIAGTMQGRNALTRRFGYDPRYRLTSATGRACAGIGSRRRLTDNPRCGSFPVAPNQANAPNVTTGYMEAYRYDPAGNLLELVYRVTTGPTQPGWRRSYGIGGLAPDQAGVPANNRLGAVRDAGTAPISFTSDAAGNLASMASSTSYEWDHAGRLIGYRSGAGAGTSVLTRYLYGADGMRVKKWVRRGGGSALDESVVRIGNMVEHQRWRRSGGGANRLLHVADGTSRIAVIRLGDPHPNDTGPAVRYELGDHLASTSVALDETGTWINREEYFPYGETSFGGFRRKRYRFCGRERDEESGLAYHGARYYAPGLCRWTAPDPAGPVDSANLFAYVSGNPLNAIDPHGRGESAAPPRTDTSQLPPWLQKQIADGTASERFDQPPSAVTMRAWDDTRDRKAHTNDVGPLELRARQAYRSPANLRAKAEAAPHIRALVRAAERTETLLNSPWYEQVILDISEHTGGNDMARAWTGASEWNEDYTKTERLGLGVKGVATAASWAAPAAKYAEGLQTVRIGLISRLPVQTSGAVRVGTAFRTAEEAAANGNHVLEVVVRSADQKVIARWWEASELGLAAKHPNVTAAEMLGHTEQKALVRMNLKPGQTVEMYGSISPCTKDFGCHWALDNAAATSGADFIYRTPRTITNYLGGEGHVESVSF